MRSSSCPVEPGLYVVRYVSSEGVGPAPAAYVKPAPGCERDIDVIMPPGQRPGALDAPGTNLVVVVHHPGMVDVMVDNRDAAESPDAKFRIECLGRSQPRLAADGAAPPIRVPEDEKSEFEPADGLRLLAHVQRRGDVDVAAGAWIAGPDDPAPIEGLSCHCSAAGVAVSLQVMTGAAARWSAWHEAESFAGTRQNASPLTAVRLRLEGGEAHRYLIVAEAMFLDSPAMLREGRDVILFGTGMMDPLMGLRVALKPAPPAVPAPPARADMPAGVPRKSSRVRVFRSDGPSAPSPSPVG